MPHGDDLADADEEADGENIGLWVGHHQSIAARAWGKISKEQRAEFWRWVMRTAGKNIMAGQQKLVTASAMALVALWASLRVGRGTAAGFLMALILNPISWAAGYFFVQWAKQSSLQNAPGTEDNRDGHAKHGDSDREVISPKRITHQEDCDRET